MRKTNLSTNYKNDMLGIKSKKVTIQDDKYNFLTTKNQSPLSNPYSKYTADDHRRDSNLDKSENLLKSREKTNYARNAEKYSSIFNNSANNQRRINLHTYSNNQYNNPNTFEDRQKTVGGKLLEIISNCEIKDKNQKYDFDKYNNNEVTPNLTPTGSKGFLDNFESKDDSKEVMISPNRFSFKSQKSLYDNKQIHLKKPIRASRNKELDSTYYNCTPDQSRFSMSSYTNPHTPGTGVMKELGKTRNKIEASLETSLKEFNNRLNDLEKKLSRLEVPNEIETKKSTYKNYENEKSNPIKINHTPEL